MRARGSTCVAWCSYIVRTSQAISHPTKNTRSHGGTVPTRVATCKAQQDGCNGQSRISHFVSTSEEPWDRIIQTIFRRATLRHRSGHANHERNNFHNPSSFPNAPIQFKSYSFSSVHRRMDRGSDSHVVASPCSHWKSCSHRFSVTSPSWYSERMPKQAASFMANAARPLSFRSLWRPFC